MTKIQRGNSLSVFQLNQVEAFHGESGTESSSHTGMCDRIIVQPLRRNLYSPRLREHCPLSLPYDVQKTAQVL